MFLFVLLIFFVCSSQILSIFPDVFVNATNIGDFMHFVGLYSWVWLTSYWLSCLPCCSRAAQIASLGYSHTCNFQGATFPCWGEICIKVKQICSHDSLIRCVMCDSTFISTWSLVTSCNFHHSSAHHQAEQMSNLNNWKHLCECAGPLNFIIPALNQTVFVCDTDT